MIYNEHLNILTRFKLLGFNPGLIIDCGSAQGKWAKLARLLFPDSPIAAFDILDYKNSDIYKIKNCQFRNAILSDCIDTPATVYFNPDYPGLTSILEDLLFTDETTKTYPCKTTTLDYIIKKDTFNPPYLLKLDTQGSELKILQGAKSLLPHTEVIITEISTINGNKGGAEFTEFIAEMDKLGFVLYTMFESGTPEDYVAQFDAVFVPRNHPWRDVYKKV